MTLQFDSLYARGEYEVIAAFYGESGKSGDDGFFYFRYTDLTDPEVFEEFITQVQNAALYSTGLTTECGDALITLSTCSYHAADGRFVVAAKRIDSC